MTPRNQIPTQDIQAPPTYADASVAMAGQRIRSKAGLGSTILTGPFGDTSAAPLATKSLLGQ